MKIEFDPAKSAKNDAERSLPFERAADLDWDQAHTIPDRRHAYGEDRFIAFAPMQGRLHVVCFSIRRGVYRIISFRKANTREEKFYAEAATDR